MFLAKKNHILTVDLQLLQRTIKFDNLDIILTN